jgi:protein-tyrosine-phosphatase/ubiquinone/menaquinone biosynthesis C-methylase UbiE
VTNVLFVCIGNAGRSQMAHAFFGRAGGAVRSAGTRPSPELHPNVIEAMGEIGIDLSGASPQGFEQADAEWADIVVTMGCGDECPVAPGRSYRDWPIDDPIGLSVEATRPIRDEIARRVAALVAELRVESSGYLSDGFAERYDAFRPRPPPALLELLCRYAGERPGVVVDLGSGTGLSAEAWASRAEQVVGVEPNPRMLAVAEARAPSNVAYVCAQAAETGLDDGTADVVTASQSFHWMAPDPTLAEVARVLRPGGVFCTYDYEWPPVIHPEIDAEFEAVIRKLGNWGRARKVEHAQRMRESGRFRYVRRVDLHSEEEGDAERVAGTAWTMGPVANRLLAEEITEKGVGLTRLREVALKVLGDRRVPFLFTYHAVLGVR